MGVHTLPLSPRQWAILDRAPQADCTPVIHEYRSETVYSATPRIQFIRPLGYAMQVGTKVMFTPDGLKADVESRLAEYHVPPSTAQGLYLFDSMSDLTTAIDTARKNAHDARMWAGRLEQTLKDARMGVETNAAGKMPSAAGARAVLKKALGVRSDYGIHSSGSQGAYSGRAYGSAYYDFGTGYVYRKDGETDAEYKARCDEQYAKDKTAGEAGAAKVRAYLAENKPDWRATVTVSETGRVTLHYAGFTSTDATYEALLNEVRSLFTGAVPSYTNNLTDEQREAVMTLVRAYHTKDGE